MHIFRHRTRGHMHIFRHRTRGTHAQIRTKGQGDTCTNSDKGTFSDIGTLEVVVVIKP